jgi:hypothetical protein
MIKPNRHDRGWPKMALLTYTVEMGQSWRFCIEPMGRRDAVWERSGYVELIIWKRFGASNDEGHSHRLTRDKGLTKNCVTP